MNSIPIENPWKDLEVPGEPGVYFCARHKSVQTRLRCGRCEKPICPKCTNYGPTGARCRDCLSMKSSHMYQISLVGGLAAFGLAMVAGVLGAIILSVVGGFSIFALLYAPAIGPALGKLIIRASGGKSGTKLAIIGASGFVVGALGSSLATALPLLMRGTPAGLAFGLMFHPFLWIMVAIAVVSLWAFLK